jgi:histone H3/H4
MHNKSYYFQHDFNAANDEKILYVRSMYGMEGYGLYWYFIELMHQSQDSKLKCKLINGISYQLNIDIDKLLQFYNTCIDTELFVTDGDFYWSQRVLENKEVQEEKRKSKSFAGKKGMEKRWSSNTYEDSITEDNTDITEHNKRKEIKGKEIKLNYKDLLINNIEEYKDLLGDSYSEFIDYWCEPNKNGKLRYELEKFFDIKRRINTWVKNKNKYGTTNKPTDASKQRMDNLKEWIHSR